jgi:transposase
MMVSVLGIDLGKNTRSLAGLDASGGIGLRQRVRRDAVLAATAKLAPCVVAMEACCGAHHLAR